MIPEPARAELRAALGPALRFDVSARRLTSLRVGGAVDALATPADRAQLATLLDICTQRGVPYRVLGRGFNTIVRDGGLDGVVIQLSKFRALSECAGAAHPPLRASEAERARSAPRADEEMERARSASRASEETEHARSAPRADEEMERARSASRASEETEHARSAPRADEEMERARFASRADEEMERARFASRADEEMERARFASRADEEMERAGAAGNGAPVARPHSTAPANAAALARHEAQAGAAAPTCFLRVEAGVSHATLTQFCQRRGLSGLEFGAGIPGSIGGWLAMNAGVPGREIESAVRELEVMTPAPRGCASLPRAQLDFRYRGLHGLAPGAVVLSALLEVTRATPAAVAARVQRELAGRAARQPLDQPSCGSVFRNPPAHHAGQLIEAAGLRGKRHGDARISEKHANFIVNEGNAGAADVLALIDAARAAVLQRTGIELETEVKVWGRETS